nr:hypothetical protein [Methanobrevibacter arboriphilus]
MKYKTIEVKGDYKELVRELNNNYQDYTLVGYTTDIINYNIGMKTTAILRCPDPKETIKCVEKSTPYLNFAEHFPKLNNEEFTTIRDKDKGIILGDVVDILAPEGRSFKAECVCVENAELINYNRKIVCDDLNLGYMSCMDNILTELNKFYPNLTHDSMVWIYTLKKV